MKRLTSVIILASLAYSAQAQITLEMCQQKAREHYPEVAQYDLIAQSEQYNLESASR